MYVATNAAKGDAIVAYRIASTGLLTSFGTYPTGGRGVGPNKLPALTPVAIDPLGSNASIKADTRLHVLLAVNAGSATVTSFSIAEDDTLKARSTVPSGGLFPTSIATSGRLVYVANVGNPSKGLPATVSGFAVARNGALTPIRNSTRNLSQSTVSQAATIVFSPDGRFLVAADMPGDRLTTFVVRPDGRLAAPVSTQSLGADPFGATFHDDTLLVQEAQGRVTGASSLSSYRLLEDGHVVPIATSIPSGQTGGCWVAARASTPFVFVSDTGNGTISSYVQRLDGTLNLLIGAAAPVVAVSGPVDLALSQDGSYLYQLYGGIGKIGIYRVASTGTLAYIGFAVGLPATGAEGLAVY